MSGVAGVGGGDEGPFAGAGGEGPTVVGFQPMVVGAQHVEQVEHGVVGVGPVDAVVALQVGLGRATLGRARGIEPLEGRLLVGGRAAAEVGHPDQGLGLRQDGGHQRLTRVQQVVHGGNRDGPVAD